jgi:hypothetical protein
VKLFGGKVEFGFSSNVDGNLDFRFDNEKVVLARRGVFFARENIDPKSTIVMIAEHESKVIIVTNKDAGRGVMSAKDQYVCDGLTTREQGLNLVLSVADCIPLVLYDKRNKILAMVHVGSKNLTNGTTKKAIETIKKLGPGNSEVSVTTGPFIKKCCYGFDRIPNHLSELRDYFIKKGNKFYLDTESALRDQLMASGIKKENILISPLCSMHDGFPSHKRSLDEKLPESRMLVYARMV